MKNISLAIIFQVIALHLLYAQQTADKYFESKDYLNASKAYEREVAYKPSSYLNLAKSYFAMQEFDKAIEALKNYRDKYPSADKEYANKFIALLERNDDPTKVTNLGNVINGPKDEYFPVISPDGKILYFTSYDRAGGSGGEDIWYSVKKEDGTWDTPKTFEQLNTSSHEDLMTISGDGNVAILFGNYVGSFGQGDLFYSVKTETGWTAPCNLGGSINTNSWEAQANLAADGKTMLFCSNRPGGYGQEDIYVSTLTENGWSKPINLGPVINTGQREMGPNLAADGKTLYFNSTGHFGFGGSDIFMSKRLDDSWTNWSTPVNLGKYINSLADDRFVSIPATGTKGYTVRTGEPDGFGESDIYQFTLPINMRPETVFNVFGKVTNESDSAVGAIIHFVDMATNTEVAKATSSKQDGNYRVSLPIKKKYQVVIDMKGYLYFTDIIDLTNPELYLSKQTIQDKMAKEADNLKSIKAKMDQLNKDLERLMGSKSDSISKIFQEFQQLASEYKLAATSLDLAVSRAKEDWLNEETESKDIKRDFKLQTIKVGAKFELKNIFFDLGKATLRDESRQELDKLYDMMDRSDIIIELGGYTDNIGSDEANMVLSQDRVNSVKNYLIGKGISESRIAAVGYGEQYPVASNDTEEGRQKNRRVEVKITEIKPREGTGVYTEEEKNKEEAKFDLLASLQNAARLGGLPEGSECSNKVSYLNNTTTTTTTTNNSSKKKYSSNSSETDRDEHIYKAFNPSIQNFGLKALNGGFLGASVRFVGEKLHEFHMEYYFKNPDFVKGTFGMGQLFTLQMNEVVNQPIHVNFGYNFNLMSMEDPLNRNKAKLRGVMNLPVGLRYIRNIKGIIIGPEVQYNLGLWLAKDFVDAHYKAGYWRVGVNARYKFIQGGLHINSGKLINYGGFRLGFAF